jgi:hypothetical protein
MAGVTQWLLVLFILSLAAQVVEAAAARAAATDTMLVELCTADGVRHVAVDRAGHPVERERPGHQLAHDCTGCLSTSGKHGIQAGRVPPELPVADFCAGRSRAVIVAVALRGLTAHPPLPARGPPIAA